MHTYVPALLGQIMPTLKLCALAAVLAAVLFFAWEPSGPEPVQAADDPVAGKPGFKLDGPPNVKDGKFTIEVQTFDSPADPISGFEVFLNFPPELKYNGSTDCRDVIKVARKDGGQITLCLLSTTIDSTHVLVHIGVPPNPNLNVPTNKAGTPLVSLDFQCNQAGTYTLTVAGSYERAQSAETIPANSGSISIDCVPPPTPTVPGMSLKVPDPVFVGQTFPLTIVTDPAPDVQIFSFAAEVLFPSELQYSGSGDCFAEVQVGRADGQPLQGICVSLITQGGAGHHIVASSANQVPPLPPLDVPSGSAVPLATFEFTCNAVGNYKLTLTSYPPSGYGATYADTNGSPILVRTEVQDGVNVADTLVINCVEPPPTPTPIGGIGLFPRAPGAPLETGGSSGAGTGVLAAVLASAVAAGATALGGAAWYTRRRLRRG